MSITWHEIAFQPEQAIADDAVAEWAWLVPEPWTPLVCSMIGGIFLLKPVGDVYWLETGTGLIKPVAKSAEEFDAIIRSSPDVVEDWFLPGLVADLHAAGKRPGPGQCYGFTILPVFAEGKYDASNMFVLPVREQLIGVAHIHRQLGALPDDSKVQLKVVD